MSNKQDRVRRFYRRLIAFYPRAFREKFAEPMEQTFHDLCKEKMRTKKEWFSFLVWTFIETVIGILKEYLWLVSPGDSMQTIGRNLGSSGAVSFLILLPFMFMEVINRQDFNEGFPYMLFFVMWLNLFAISLILLPIVQARRTANHGKPDSVTAQGDTFSTNPRSALIISIALFLFPVALFVLNSIGWAPLAAMLNGTNPEQTYIPGQVIALLLISIPVAAGIIAGRPIVRTMRTGGSLFAHPMHLVIVSVILVLFTAGVVGLIVDQWPCFMGVPNCD